MLARRNIFIAVGALCVAVFLTWFFFVSEETRVHKPRPNAPPPPVDRQVEKALAHLYFADRSGSFLMSSERLLPHAKDPAGFAKAIIEALIKGPPDTLARTIPLQTAARALYITADGVCYVDFTDAIRNRFPGGVKAEILTIYSIVNSLILNVPQIETVKILINGHESMTLAGHIDLQYPFKTDMLLIR